MIDRFLFDDGVPDHNSFRGGLKQLHPVTGIHSYKPTVKFFTMPQSDRSRRLAFMRDALKSESFEPDSRISAPILSIGRMQRQEKMREAKRKLRMESVKVDSDEVGNLKRSVSLDLYFQKEKLRIDKEIKDKKRNAFARVVSALPQLAHADPVGYIISRCESGASEELQEILNWSLSAKEITSILMKKSIDNSSDEENGMTNRDCFIDDNSNNNCVPRIYLRNILLPSRLRNAQNSPFPARSLQPSCIQNSILSKPHSRAQSSFYRSTVTFKDIDDDDETAD